MKYLQQNILNGKLTSENIKTKKTLRRIRHTRNTVNYKNITKVISDLMLKSMSRGKVYPFAKNRQF